MTVNVSRREFLQGSLGAALYKAIPKIPEWIHVIEDKDFVELVKICKEILTEDEVLDVMDVEDFWDALGLVFTMLLEHGEDPEEYLIMQNFLA